MTDIATLKAVAESALLDISKQAFILASGLQNAAPGEHVRAPNKSVQYLFDIAEKIHECAEKCKKIPAESALAQATKLQELIQQVTILDKNLREQCSVKSKFRFVEERLNQLLEHVGQAVVEFKEEVVKPTDELRENEMLVYVYLFNAQGLILDTWRKMLNPAVFYEHSVNRPIYTEKMHVEGFVGRKTNKVQHAYLTIAINKADILQNDEPPLKDIYDNLIIKVREGSLRVEKTVAFTHNGIDYVVGVHGALTKKVN